MNKFHKNKGLYAITDSLLIPTHLWIENIELAIQGGASIIQYRDKSLDKAKRYQQATDLLLLCKKYHIPLLINDDIALAQAIHADGVHLGKEDANIQIARKILGEKAIIGISCYNQLFLAKKAVAEGADYVAFGSFFSSKIKPDAAQADIALLREARIQLSCPIVAIGGITSHNGRLLVEAGADFLAVISDIFAATDIRQAAQSYQHLFI